MRIQLQMQWLLLMGWTGWQITGAFDTMHVLMRASGLHPYLRTVFHCLFAGLAALYLFRQLLILNGGEIRLALMLAAAAGGWVYWKWFRPWVERITESIVRIIRLVLQYCKRLLLAIIFRPVWIILTFIFSPLINRISKCLNYSLTKLRKRIKIFKRHLTKND